METQEQGQQPRRPSAWGKPELAHFEQRLLEERKRALIEMARFDEVLDVSQQQADGEITAYPFHMADQGTDSFEREKQYLLATREGRLLWHIDEGLRRLYRSPETFGTCSECGERISYERLDAIPYVVTCARCKQSWESARAD